MYGCWHVRLSMREAVYLHQPDGVGEADALRAAEAAEPLLRAALPQQLPLSVGRQPRDRPHLQRDGT